MVPQANSSFGKFAFSLVVLWTSACSSESVPDRQQPVQPSALGCTKDIECKDDRICDAGVCKAPGDAVSNGGDTVRLGRLKSGQTQSELCRKGDNRKAIPIWQPTLINDDVLGSAPPQKDGQIVYIDLYADAQTVQCNNTSLNSFSLPNAEGGGLLVNIRGNTQSANGMCYFKGYFMNEEVMGMHQGWIETYFGAVPKEKIAISSDFCLSRPIH